MDYSFICEIMKEASKIMLGACDIENQMDIKPGDSNFVTKFDVAVQKYLCENISKKLPAAVIIGEESDNNEMQKIKESIAIIIDPIDGTTNFIHNYRMSAISVGIWDCGAPAFGAVYNPYLDIMYHAQAGSGAFMTQKGKTKKISVTDHALCDSLAAFGTCPYYRDLADVTFDTAKWLFLHTREIRRTGTAAIDISHIASGCIDIFFEYKLSPWDFAAAAVILTEAGGIITQMDGSPLTLDKPCSVVAGNKTAYKEFLSANVLKT